MNRYVRLPLHIPRQEPAALILRQRIPRHDLAVYKLLIHTQSQMVILCFTQFSFRRSANRFSVDRTQ
ncbi:hypothetical protein DPMN_027580 [Dreissena polymorpha]|uniref:Uncharacterized protein n=1 Tax=Dreissena polymorpha TaxID=45954 RepID=A0A9D4LV16_DREPO|nr:hypothetical protein DPMN_027580 [Dreissena polymorpha]